ncbi:helix-turn-helix domain-containing protein [Legionella sp. km772]|uniref:helix-turn-helix domain-containing protein n=1 Tax=Legionella sp. km772 TaxID=2498111 RepID=UPI000F8F810E|nr:helix-turn-helix domain-containing protein [Legionella sp. km772]RUR11602.1 DNA-binding protein [Legionella sp. km772]
MKTLDINQAAQFFGAHRETIRRMAATGKLPGVKVGRSWVFLEQDLVMHIRNKYSSCDASQGVHNRSSKTWRSTKEMGSGGLTFSTKENEYVKVLGLK